MYETMHERSVNVSASVIENALDRGMLYAFLIAADAVKSTTRTTRIPNS